MAIFGRPLCHRTGTSFVSALHSSPTSGIIKALQEVCHQDGAGIMLFIACCLWHSDAGNA